MLRFRACALALASLFASLLAAAPAAAVVTRWNTNFSGDYNVAANWDNGVPDGDDTAVFARGSGVTYAVKFPGNTLVQPPAIYRSNIVLVDSSTVSFTQSTEFNRGNSTYQIGALLLIADFFPDVVVNTTLGNLSAFRSIIASGPNAVGTLNVNAGNFRVTDSNQSEYELTVGDRGRGAIHLNSGNLIINGAQGNAVVGANAGGIGEVIVSGPNSVWNNLSDSAFAPLVVGDLGMGTLTIQNGGKVNDFASRVGLSPGSVGSVIVQGPGSTWTNRGDSIIGVEGHGELHIIAGGRVDDNFATIGGDGGGTGAAEVSDAGSVWNQTLDLNVGEYLGTSNGVDVIGFGTLNVINAGQINTGGDANITGLTSKATIDGSGSIWNVVGELSIEFAARLEVKSGGRVDSNTAFVGSFRDGTATVSGIGATWNVADILSVGRTNTGTLNVTGGGHLTSRLAFLGVRGAIFSQSSALVQIDGVGSTWTGTEQLFVGYEGVALLLVTGGAHVTSGTGQIGFTTAGDGRVHVNGAGSMWTCTESLYVGVAGTGILQVSNGGIAVVDDLLSIGPGGTVQGNSTVRAEVRNGGTVAPGVTPSFVQTDALGTLHLDGDYTQTAAGTLAIQLGSTANFDKLTIDGHAALAGTLRLSLFGGFMPAAGDTFQVLTATDGITGTFKLSFASLSTGTGTGSGFLVVYSNSDVVLRFVNFLPGDFNRDGTVDAADYVVWRNGLGTTFTQDDYFVWRAHFGQSAGSGSLVENGSAGASPFQATVPEPASLMLTCLALAALAWNERRVVPRKKNSNA